MSAGDARDFEAALLGNARMASTAFVLTVW